MTATAPLAGIRVLDFTQMMAGPFATQMLGDLGADIIKIEKLDVGEWERSLPSMGEFLRGQSPFFLAMNRNKRSLAIDLKHHAARQVVLDLARTCDVAINNFRPGALEKLGLGAEDLRGANPDLIVVNSTGFGSTGPMARNPGQDLLLQAVSGMAAQSGSAAHGPTPLATSIVDAATALMNVIAVLTALLARQRGRPAESAVDVDMLSTAFALQCQEVFAHQNLDQRWSRSEEGLAAPWNSAPYGIYEVADGHVAIAMADLTTVARAIDDEDLAATLAALDPYGERDAVRRALGAAIAGWSRDALVATLGAHGVWTAPVLDLDEVVALDQLAVNGAQQVVRHPHYGDVVVGTLPFRMSGAPDQATAPPMPGEHTTDILAELGYAADDIARLLQQRVVSAWSAA